MRKSAYLVVVVILTILVLSIVQVVVANRISTTGLTLAKLQEEVKEYKRENTLIKEKILKDSSLTEIASSAATLGFAPSKENLKLGVPLPLAKR